MTALVLLIPGLFAQRRDDRGRSEPPGRGDERGRSNPRGEHISRVIADCEQRTNEFRASFRHASDRSFQNHMRMEDLVRHASSLERSMNAIRESWNRERNPDRTRRFVSSALENGREINRALTHGRVHPEIQRQWSAIKSELNRLAEVFELPRIRWE